MSAAEDERRLFELHARFCAGFADRDGDAILATMADRDDLVVVTSEDALLEGADQFRSFVRRYVDGATTYSWSWDRRRGLISDGLGLLLAVGTELAVTGDHRIESPYRMTLVASLGPDGSSIQQIHGSSPHQA